ncbi:hypothetical protein [Azotobacter chroococcum]|uniref:hypothetical protein n=1 Tax=Azotobacter chroococcum TaxID=353 RepID=UPI0010AE2B9A|nr:hypothetical protein [Azotobacter chroococcum]TKD39922.1 hypothetical protein FCG41_11860 [Azotobacter chroococcum]
MENQYGHMKVTIKEDGKIHLWRDGFSGNFRPDDFDGAIKQFSLVSAAPDEIAPLLHDLFDIVPKATP